MSVLRRLPTCTRKLANVFQTGGKHAVEIRRLCCLTLAKILVGLARKPQAGAERLERLDEVSRVVLEVELAEPGRPP